MDIPVVIHKEDGSVYGVSVPDIPGCYSHGETIEEAINNTKEAIYGHVSILLELNEPVSITASKIENLIQDPEYANGIWAVVDIDMSKIDTKPERINISIPRFVLSKIDTYVEKRHETRSGFLSRAALDAISKESKEEVAA
ncbi:type II toxin-antitoxin system HicB family antitoxin [Undibacterium sp. SXout11W]|uniref:type II toxin-antitoxin system HicB family antitoxin n=1 Tax=Undibacterium sp. SXout11W TaxID=3413050 RepID=UPI003BF10F22